MTETAPESRYDVLIQKHLDEALSSAESRELQAWLLADTAHMDYLLTQTDIHVELHEEQLVTAMGVDIHAVDEASLIGPARREEPDRLRLVWLKPLAIAASLLIATGVFWIVQYRSVTAPATASNLPKVLFQTGRPDVRANSISTPDEAFCTADLGERVLVAVADNSSVSWTPAGEAGTRILEAARGQIYVHADHPPRPLQVRCGSLRTDILGTRLVFAREPVEAISCLEGSVMVTGGSGQTGVRVHAGQQATLIDSTPGQKHLLLQPCSTGPGVLAWLNRCGLSDAESGIARFRQPAPGRAPAGLDLSRCVVKCGQWEVTPGGSTLLKRIDLDAQGIICLGGPKWRKGTVSCSFRVLKRKNPDVIVNDPANMPMNPENPRSSVGFQFYYGQYWSEGLHCNVDQPQLENTWITMRAEFEAQEDAGIVLKSFDVWNKAIEGGQVSRKNWQSSVIIPVRRGGACGIGLSTVNCQVEIRDLLVENGVPAGRVEDALLARYRFDEGSGTVVADSAAMGEPMDFTIKEPTLATWQANGLTVNGKAMLTTATCTKLAEAFKKSGGLTLEFWQTPPVGKTVDSSRQYAVLDFIWKQGWFNYTQTYLKETVLPRSPTVYAAVTLTRKGRDAIMLTYNGSNLVKSQELQNIAMAISDLPFHLTLPGAAAPNMAADTEPWTGTYHFVGIHGRALSLSEIQANHQAGMPGQVQPSRLTDDLLGLYPFDEGTGTVIRNRAGTGRAMDLHVNKPGAVQWMNKGLNVKGPADIMFRTPSSAIHDAWLKNKGVTVEVWLRMPRTPHRPDARYCHSKLIAGEAHFGMIMRGPILSNDLGRLCQTVFTLTREGDKTMGRYHTDGKFDSLQDLSSFAGYMDKNPVSLALSPSLLLGDQQRWKEFDILGVAIYGRALTPVEISQNFAAGQPRQPPIGQPSARPLVLYRFDEGAGTTIRDHGATPDALNLVIRRPELAAWTPTGLKLSGSADIQWATPGTPFRDAWKDNNGITLALWTKFPATRPPAQTNHVWAQLESGPLKFDCTFSAPKKVDLGQYTLAVLSIKRMGNKTVFAFFTNDEPSTVGQEPALATVLDNPMRLNLAPPGLPPPKGLWNDLEICHFAIFDRSFDMNQVQQYYRSGPPRRH